MTDPNQVTDANANVAEVLREKMIDAMTPGYQAEFDPEEAEHAGAFVEDALSEQDAAESGYDLVDVDDLAPAVDTENVRSLYDWKLGE